MFGMSKSYFIVAAVLSLSMLSACTPEVGSAGWCADIKEKPKGELTANEITDYARHCMLK